MKDNEIINATLQLPERGGRGVLVPGRMILTAAHCIEWAHEGVPEPDARGIQTLQMRGGQKLRIRPIAVEPVLDLAVLGAPDEQEFPKDSVVFAEFCRNTPEVLLSNTGRRPHSEFPVRILAHDNKWIGGRAQFVDELRSRICIETDSPITAESIGGPILDEHGTLLGVVPKSFGTSGSCNGHVGFAYRALPPWIVEWVERSQKIVYVGGGRVISGDDWYNGTTLWRVSYGFADAKYGGNGVDYFMTPNRYTPPTGTDILTALFSAEMTVVEIERIEPYYTFTPDDGEDDWSPVENPPSDSCHSKVFDCFRDGPPDRTLRCDDFDGNE